MQEIVNKVANSALEVFDLEDYFPQEELAEIDVCQFLFEGIILKEIEFRAALKTHNWQQYQNRNIAINISSDLILPAWATLLITVYLQPFAKTIIVGSRQELLGFVYNQVLSSIDFSVYQNKAVILKGCSKKPVPESAYIFALQKLQKVAKSIMYGEACSAVPLFKKHSTV